MIDFIMISTRATKKGTVEIYPKFIIKKSSDLMIKGRDFYAIWLEERGLWSTDEQDVIKVIDDILNKYAEEHKEDFDSKPRVMHMWDAESGIIDAWHRYCQKQMRDNYHQLDEQLIFSNMTTTRTDYASKRLSYPLESGDYSAYDKIIGTLYSEKERHKIEWAIGAIVSGESKSIQKFVVLYGAPGSGKGTILDIILSMFEGYCAVFDAKALGSSNNVFALEAFKSNPLVAVQHDGDLSKIEDNTRLNSLVSHERMSVNEKFKGLYENKFNSFLFMGTNKPVKITDGKAGLIRRLIDVSPSGEKLSSKEYKDLTGRVKFELGAIACHCRDVFLADPEAYDSYTPTTMLGATNDFYNYMLDVFFLFKKDNCTTLKAAWELYKTFCEDAKVMYPMSQRTFQEELKNYFDDYSERSSVDGTRLRKFYSGFRYDKFDMGDDEEKVEAPKDEKPNWIIFDCIKSIFDEVCCDCFAQYGNDDGIPTQKWDLVKTKLSDLDTSKLHYVKVPENHIVVDFDIPDESGNKSFEKNLEAASKWPPTYAELSKSGAGIHLHYIYVGDAAKLGRIFADHIEIKVFTGKSSLRRKLTKCNNLPIATISSGLPVKGEKMVNFDSIKSEKQLRIMLEKNLRKEIHPGTKPSVDFIFKILDDAYKSGLKYDVSDMRAVILAFAANSTHQAEYCIKLVSQMPFKSEEASDDNNIGEAPIVFYDVEVFPNLFLVNWKMQGEGHKIVRMINPTSTEIEEILHYRLIGFNCRRYDNHMSYARLMGYTNEQLYNLSQKIISGGKNCFFNEAYNLSYTDIYDFASAGNKKSLKKLEIEMGIHHQELGLPWDKPVPENLWLRVAEYCDNDVIATEAAFGYLSADWTARQILAEWAGMSYNDTSNSLTTRIIFGKDRKPQSQFIYRNLAEPVFELDPEVHEFLRDACPEMMAQAHGEAKSLLPYFEGYEFKNGKSSYRGENIGEGGYVYAEPGMYGEVALLDVVSMHPHSTMAECHFGAKYTKGYKNIVDGRVNIKHENWQTVHEMFDGKLDKYVQKVIDGEMPSKALANAIKTPINSVYGLTSASFDNPFKDPRNVDNIVAKRGELFMIDLKHEVQKRGFIVAHIKTDSIKIPDATPEIIQFVMDFGKRYGYTFEHEETYEKMCLVNDAVYVAKYKTPHIDKKTGKEIWWTATGTQFQIPYVFKSLFTHEDITFSDLCETKSVSSALYLDKNENLPDVSKLEKELAVITKGEREPERQEELKKLIADGHAYIFIGKVGLFCPIKDGYRGGLLMREKDGKYYAATGSKGYRWLEADEVKEREIEDGIDRSYYDALVNDAVKSISEYGDFEWFASDDPYTGPSIVNGKPLYFDEPPIY